jgi:putative transposase
LRPAVRRDVVAQLRVAYDISERRACKTTGFERSSQRYRSARDPQTALRIRLKDLAAVRVRYGYRRLHVLLRREGWVVNHKRVYRLYNEEGLSIRAKLPRRKRAWRYRAGRSQIISPNDVWAMDFMSDALFDGRPFRLLTVVDCCSREGLATVPRATFRAFNVVEVLDRLAAERGKPKTIRVDNGPEFAGRLLDQWAYLNGVELDFSRPGTPRIMRSSRLLTPASEPSVLMPAGSFPSPMRGTELKRVDYNTERPHSALGHLTPEAFARQVETARKVS